MKIGLLKFSVTAEKMSTNFFAWYQNWWLA